MRLRNLTVILLITVSCAGCAGKLNVVEVMSREISLNKFQEIPKESSPLAGYADIEVASSIKTRKHGVFLIENTAHGTPGYLLWLSIDGQLLRINGDPRPDQSGYTGEINPEAGDGIRYHFNAHVRLTPGMHKFIVGLPEDGVLLEKEMLVKEGRNRLVISPVYRKTSREHMIGFSGKSSFFGGVKGIEMSLN